MSEITYKKVSKSGCSSQKARYVITLPFGVNKTFISKCKKNGFIDSKKHTDLGLLFLKKENITLSGSLCVKYINATCALKSDKNCEMEIKNIVNLLNKII